MIDRPTTLVGIERALHATMDRLNEAVTEANERLAASGSGALDEAAERMAETARSRPLGNAAVLVAAGRAQVERCRAAVAEGRARASASAARAVDAAAQARASLPHRKDRISNQGTTPPRHSLTESALKL